jgi:hypothetical protein
MPKIFYFLFITTILLIVLMGFFFWSVYSDDIKDVIPAVKMEPPENYRIFETEEGKFVENSNVGLKFKVPDGWDVERQEVGIDEWVINITSPDIQFGEDGMLSEGCGFSAWVEQREDIANMVRFRMKEPEKYSKEINGIYETIYINEKSALKMILSRENWGSVVGIQIPIEDKVIYFDTLFRPDTKQRCSEILDQFLDRVEIK